MEKMRMESIDRTAQNIDKLATLFPNCITETVDENGKLKRAINFELLRQMLSADVVEGDEAYEFSWVGKKAAIVDANKPIRKTIRPLPEDSVEWDTTKNLYIEGDNLEVLKLLQESYLGSVKMIYIDPPYNTGNDFIYRDTFSIDAESYDMEGGNIDAEGIRLFRNTDTNGRFHSDWCSMIYSRLTLARNLLSDEGVIFISIDEKESANLRKICDEVFGEANFVSNIIWQSRTSISNDYEVSLNHNHTLIYSKRRDCLVFGGDPIDSDDYINPDNDPRGPWKLVPLDANHAGGDTVYPVTNPKTGVDYFPPNGRIWCYNREGMQKLLDDGRIKFGLNDDSSPKRKLYLNERMEKGDKKTPSSILLDAGTTKDGTTEIMRLFGGEKVFDYPKPVELIKLLIRYGAPDGGLVMDFFSGSATTAQAVMEYSYENEVDLSYILVQLPENLDESYEMANSSSKKALKNVIDLLDNLEKPHFLTEVAKERIRRAIRESDTKAAKQIDSGFRVLKVDESNMNDVYYSAGEYTQGLLTMLESNIKSDRTDLDLLFGCLLEWGLPLSLPYSSEKMEDCTVHTYNDGDLIACFDENIPDSVIREIAKRQPLRAVFRDSSFNGSPAKINVGEIFKMLAPDTRVKVI
jgi:hypothetical protein